MVSGNFPMAPRMHDPDTCRNLTGNHLIILSYYLVTTRQTQEHGALFCLGESPEFKCFDLLKPWSTWSTAVSRDYMKQHGTTRITRLKCLVQVMIPECLTKRH